LEQKVGFQIAGTDWKFHFFYLPIQPFILPQSSQRITQSSLSFSLADLADLRDFILSA